MTNPTRTTSARVLEVPVPPSLDAPEAWAVHGTALVDAAIEEQIHGNTDMSLDAALTLSTMVSEQDYKRIVRLVAVRADADPAHPGAQDVIGRATVGLPQQNNTHVALAFVGVHPDHRRQGVGTALWEACLERVREAGRTVVMSDSAYGVEPPPGPDALEAPTGSGRVPVPDDATSFALHRGFALEQVTRHSVLALPVPAGVLDPLRAQARAAADVGSADGYRVHVWRDEVPDEWIDQFAVLETRMSTDAPTGGLEIEEDPWDAERVREASAAILGRGRGYLIAAAEHTPSGTLAAFSMVVYPLDRPEVVIQEDTLVLREHRGRRLGMLTKIAVLDELATLRPDARRVHTWNAEENAHMLAINVALGFRPAGVVAEWQAREV